MNKQSERTILFDIPEDQTIDSDFSIGNCSSDDSSSNGGFFQKLGQTFKKLNGEDGANVNALRGIYGSDYESYAVVCRATPGSSWLTSKLKKNDPKERFLLIKGAFCFVFKDEHRSAPKYVIRLAHTKTQVVNVTRQMTTVVMQSRLGDDKNDLESCEFVFLRETDANCFSATANYMAAQGETEEIQDRLGDEYHLLDQRKSVRCAEKIAIEKMDDQPDKPSPISAGEVANFLDSPIVDC
ncbi:MAG: hypothetical protein SGBAC_009098 [Bacillariaceae sp.]